MSWIRTSSAMRIRGHQITVTRDMFKRRVWVGWPVGVEISGTVTMGINGWHWQVQTRGGVTIGRGESSSKSDSTARAAAMRAARKEIEKIRRMPQVQELERLEVEKLRADGYQVAP